MLTESGEPEEANTHSYCLRCVCLEIVLARDHVRHLMRVGPAEKPARACGSGVAFPMAGVTLVSAGLDRV